jgi:hypothetical protein
LSGNRMTFENCEPGASKNTVIIQEHVSNQTIDNKAILKMPFLQR